MLKLKAFEFEVIFSFINHDGYVFDFSDTGFDAFTKDSVGVEVKKKYRHLGLSKGKSLEKFVREVADASIAVTLLSDLLEYFALKIKGTGSPEDISRSEVEYMKVKALISRIRLDSTPPREERSAVDAFHIEPIRIPVNDDCRIIPAHNQPKPTAFDEVLISQARSAISELHYRQEGYVWPLECESGYLEGMRDRLKSTGSIRKFYEAILNYPRFTFPDGREVAIKPQYLEPEEYPLVCQLDKKPSFIERVYKTMELPEALSILIDYLDACGKFSSDCMKVAARAELIIGELRRKCWYEPSYRPIDYDDLKPIIDICDEMYISMKTLDTQPKQICVVPSGPAERKVVMIPKNAEQAVEAANAEEKVAYERRREEVFSAFTKYARVAAIGGKPFDFVASRLREELEQLKCGNPVCPRENICWQQVLKPILNYTPRCCEFSVAGDCDDDFDLEVNGINGAKFRLIAHDVKVEESDLCGDIVSLTKQYINAGAELARSWNSKSVEYWDIAQIALKRCGCTMRLKSSREQVNRMVDAMISAAEIISLEAGPVSRNIGDVPENEYFERVKKELKPKERSKFLVAVTQKELAILLGYKSADSVRKWESGTRNAPIGYTRGIREQGGLELMSFINTFRRNRGIAKPLKAIKNGKIVDISSLSEIDADLVLEFVRKKTSAAETKEGEENHRKRAAGQG